MITMIEIAFSPFHRMNEFYDISFFLFLFHCLDDPLLLEVNYTPFQLNNKTILDDKCPPGWSLILDTCYMYVGAPMTFFEAREFCRSDNATMPFIRGGTDVLWLYLQRQMVHLRYPDRVWIQDLSHLEQCTSFLYRTVEIDDCNSKRGFICEIDPKVRDSFNQTFPSFSNNLS